MRYADTLKGSLQVAGIEEALSQEAKAASTRRKQVVPDYLTHTLSYYQTNKQTGNGISNSFGHSLHNDLRVILPVGLKPLDWEVAGKLA